MLLAVAWLSPCTGRAATGDLRRPGEAALRRLEEHARHLLHVARRDAGLGALVSDRALSTAAREYSADMAELNFVGHVSPRFDRRTTGARLAAAGLSDAQFGEIVGRFGTSREGATLKDFLTELFARLLASDAHRPQILGRDYTVEGTGVAIGMAPADADSSRMVEVVYLTQLFVARRISISRIAVRGDGTGMRLDVQAFLRSPGRARLRIRRAERPVEDVPLRMELNTVTASISLPAADGRAHLALDVVELNRTRPAHRWLLDPLQPPDLVVRPAPDDE